MIVRNSEWELLDRALKSVEGCFDGVFVTVADKVEPGDEITAVANKYGAELSHFTWCNNFSAARNFNMDIIRSKGFDWYTWMDVDDEVEGAEKAHDFLSKLTPDIKFVICTYNYSFFKNGKVSTKHPKERFIRLDSPFKWKGWLHETCVSETNFRGVSWNECIWNHRTEETRILESKRRNVAIVEAEIEAQVAGNDVDPRTIFNLGMAYAGVAEMTASKDDWTRAIRAFNAYLQKSGWDEHAYMALKYIGIANTHTGNHVQALNAFMEAWKLCPWYSDACAMLAEAYRNVNKLRHAETLHKFALQVGEENAYAVDEATNSLTSHFSLAQIFAAKADFANAKKHIEAAKKLVGDDEDVNRFANEIKRIEKLDKQAKKALLALEELPEESREAYYNKLPIEVKANPRITFFRRKMKWKQGTNGKEIVIMTGQTVEEWNPESAKTGIGGSEEAVIYLAQELKQLGWTVTVYGNHGPYEHNYDGVTYKPYWEFSPDEPMDIFISWRDAGIFDFQINAKKKYCWFHDVVPEEVWTPSRINNLDKLIVLSKFHRSLYPSIPEEKIMVSANGILPEHFDVKVERVKNRVLYTSAPNRGLELLLALWPKVREQVPDAELYWAYGWQTFDKMQESNPQAAKYKERITQMLKQDGVHDLGRIGHEELAELMLSGDVWAYPTEFEEIFCITAIKMQAAGCVPVCTDVAALDEVVQYGTKVETKKIYRDEEKQKEFIEAVVTALNTQQDRESMQAWARENWTWGKVATQWNDDFVK